MGGLGNCSFGSRRVFLWRGPQSSGEKFGNDLDRDLGDHAATRLSPSEGRPDFTRCSHRRTAAGLSSGFTLGPGDVMEIHAD